MVSKLGLLEREQLFKLLAQNIPKRAIAKTLNRHPSTIYREIKRINGEYSPIFAQNDALLKSKNSKKHKKLQNIEFQKYVKDRILLYWSPEQISNRLKIEYPNNRKMNVSTETIYQFIYSVENGIEKARLIKYLRRRKKRRHSRKNKIEHRGKIINLTSIHDRPKSVNTRKEPGHWEGDLIVGKDHKTAIGTLVERKTRYTIIVPLIKKKDSYNTVKSFIQVFNKLPKELKKSLTYDRGLEMAYHEMFTKATDVPVYFADPHSPYQRGTNENTNGLIRNFFPKKTDFSNFREIDFYTVQDLLNNRPKKVLNYKTPQEAISKFI